MSLWMRSCSKLERIFADSPAPLAACSALKVRLEAFNSFVPVIEALRTPGLKDRHWAQLSAVIGHEIRPEPSLAFQLLVEVGVPNHLAACLSIAEIAGKEHSFERNLEKMRSEWSNIAFDLVPYKATGTHVLRALDDITLLLDDHILKAQVTIFPRNSHSIMMLHRHHMQHRQPLIFHHRQCEAAPSSSPSKKRLCSGRTFFCRASASFFITDILFCLTFCRSYMQETLDAWLKVRFHP